MCQSITAKAQRIDWGAEVRIVKEFKDPCAWHDYFCLLPRVITWTDTEFKIVWLETVERRKLYLHTYWFYQYRFKEDKK